MSLFVFDIDGTLADPSERLHHIIGPNKDWDAYDALWHTDKPIPAIITIARCLYDAGHEIMLLTGRNERTRDATTSWLYSHSIEWRWLVMRAADDSRPDTEVKLENLAAFLKHLGLRSDDVQTIFEDRKRLAEAFRAAGYHVCHVAEGDF